MILYHVTKKENIEKIMNEGLIPMLGKYAVEMGECIPSVWLFPDIDDAKEMAPIWLEPFYGPDLVYLKVYLPDNTMLEYTGSDYEVYVTTCIPPSNISIVNNGSHSTDLIKLFSN